MTTQKTQPTPKNNPKSRPTSRTKKHNLKPDFSFEAQYYEQGHRFVAGVDEVGRGCLAGPVVAAAVILDPNNYPIGMNDSKKLSALQRARLSREIYETSLAWALGIVSPEEIDSINILQASRKAMLLAVQQLNPQPDVLLIDGRDTIDSALKQHALISGDSRALSISAASIIAKVYRDQLMVEADEKYPGYHFASNKGYGSLDHRKQLTVAGPTILHRKSFSWAPVHA